MSNQTSNCRNPVGTLSRSEGSTDAVFAALAHQYRRRSLVYLSPDTPSSVAEIAEYVATTTREADAERVALMLHHDHLPKLAAAGLVEYRPNERTALLTPEGAQAERIHDLAAERGRTR